MASNDDQPSVSKDQIDAAKEMAEAMRQMLDVSRRLNSSISQQTKTFQEMCSAIECMKKESTLTSASITEIGNNINKIDQEKVDKLSSALEDLKKNADKSESSISKLGKALRSGLSTYGKIAGGVLTGLSHAFKLVTWGAKQFLSIIGSVVKGLYKIGRAILSIPITIIKTLFAMAARTGGGGISELAKALNDLKESFGKLSSPANRAITGIAGSMMSLSKYGFNAFRTFGTFAERIKVVEELFKSAGSNFRSFGEEMVKYEGSIAVFAHGLGLSGEQLEAFALKSRSTGEEITKTMIDVTKYSSHLAGAFNLTSKVISRGMGKAAQDMKHFGNLSEKQLAIAVTYAEKLGIQLEGITGSFDKFTTFDDAADNISKLNEAFNTNIDLGEVMSEQDPTAQFELIRKGLLEAGIQGEKMTHVQRRMLQSVTGWDDATMISALSTKNQSIQLKDIQKEAEKAEKKTMDFGDAIKELTGAIKENLKAGSPPDGSGFWDRFLKGMKRAFEMNPTFQRLMLNIRKMFIGAYQSGFRFGDMLLKKIPFITTVMEALTDVFDPVKFEKLTSGITKVFGKFFDTLKTDPIQAFKDLQKDLLGVFTDFAASESPAMKKLFEGFKQAGEFVIKIIAGLVPAIMDKVSFLAETLADFILDPRPFKKKIIDLGKKIAGASKLFGKSFSPIGDAVMKAWPRMQKAFDKLWENIKKAFENWKRDKWPELQKKIQEAIWELFKMSLTSKVGLAKLAISFGPGVFGAITSWFKGRAIKAQLDQIRLAQAELKTLMANQSALNAQLQLQAAQPPPLPRRAPIAPGQQLFGNELRRRQGLPPLRPRGGLPAPIPGLGGGGFLPDSAVHDDLTGLPRAGYGGAWGEGGTWAERYTTGRDMHGRDAGVLPSKGQPTGKWYRFGGAELKSVGGMDAAMGGLGGAMAGIGAQQVTKGLAEAMEINSTAAAMAGSLTGTAVAAVVGFMQGGPVGALIAVGVTTLASVIEEVVGARKELKEMRKNSDNQIQTMLNEGKLEQLDATFGIQKVDGQAKIASSVTDAEIRDMAEMYFPDLYDRFDGDLLRKEVQHAVLQKRRQLEAIRVMKEKDEEKAKQEDALRQAREKRKAEHEAYEKAREADYDKLMSELGFGKDGKFVNITTFKHKMMELDKVSKEVSAGKISLKKNLDTLRESFSGFNFSIFPEGSVGEEASKQLTQTVKALQDVQALFVMISRILQSTSQVVADIENFSAKSADGKSSADRTRDAVSTMIGNVVDLTRGMDKAVGSRIDDTQMLKLGEMNDEIRRGGYKAEDLFKLGSKKRREQEDVQARINNAARGTNTENMKTEAARLGAEADQAFAERERLLAELRGKEAARDQQAIRAEDEGKGARPLEQFKNLAEKRMKELKEANAVLEEVTKMQKNLESMAAAVKDVKVDDQNAVATGVANVMRNFSSFARQMGQELLTYDAKDAKSIHELAEKFKGAGAKTSIVDAMEELDGVLGAGKTALGNIQAAADWFKENAGSAAQSVMTIGPGLKSVQQAVEGIDTTISEKFSEKIAQVKTAIDTITEKAKELELKLHAGHDIDIQAAMNEFLVKDGKVAGVSGGAFSVTSKEVVINVSFQVAMDATNIETAILQSNSKIKSSINNIIQAIPAEVVNSKQGYLSAAHIP